MKAIPNKRAVLDSFVKTLRSALDALTESQQASQAGATHEESRSEHSKDTRALESSYLARGLAARVLELRRDLVEAETLTLEDFSADTPISLSALIELADETSGEHTHYFLTPVAGGMKLDLDGVEITTVTPAAPLGQALNGRELGTLVELRTPHGTKSFTISDLS